MVGPEVKLRFVRNEIVLPHGRTVGEELDAGRDSWVEDEILRPAFDVDDGGLPRHRLLYLELARGHWKSGGIGAIAVTEAALEPDTEVVVVAGDTDQAGIVLAHIDGYLDRRPGLAALVTRRGNERHFEGGSVIRVISSDAPTAYGLGGVKRRFRLLADEVTVWKPSGEELWAALASATGKVADVQTLIGSNAGFDSGTSWQWRVREAARTQPWGRLFAPEGVLASWISPEWIEQQRVLLPPIAFERVILNRWTAAAGDFVSPEAWALCVDERLHSTRRGSGYRGSGLDLGLTKDRTALAIVHLEGDYLVLDELDVWQGTRAAPVSIATIERALLDASERFPGLETYADPWQLKGSIERLRGRLRIREFVFSASSVQKLSQTLHGAITSARLRVYADAELEREILGLRVVQTGSGWRMDHRAGGYSDRAVALAMALQLVEERGRRRVYRSGLARGRIPGADTAEYEVGRSW